MAPMASAQVYYYFSLGFPVRGPWGARGAEKGREMHRGRGFWPTLGHYTGLFTIVINCNKVRVEEIVDETVIDCVFFDI